MSLVEYRETIDYTWCLARQFDRVAEAITEAGRKANKASAVEAVCFAAYALSILAAPFTEASFSLRECLRLARDGKLLVALEEASRLVSTIARELDCRGLLIRKTELLLGRFEEGGGHEG